ncbi:Nodulin-26 [Stylosanthes scabra]|uniref:Nodulin-26 n=1 Tax=Stylosanthes scabra TaxID=79078 RepID=A0ABU6Z2I5_9FABA|nr:Nodulin-26 [Stylosanthes scabra]
MGEYSSKSGDVTISVTSKEDAAAGGGGSCKTTQGGSCKYFLLFQKMVAELVGTYFLIFTGCAAIAANNDYGKQVTLLGIATVWGLVVMIIVYTIGHVSGAHLNPAVTIAFASIRKFPLAQVPAYIAAEVLGGILGSGTVRLIFSGNNLHVQFTGTLPTGSNLQSFIIEFIITFFLMFVICGVATDNRAVGTLAGVAIGSTVLLNVLIAAQVSGASMNPARSLGPAFVHHEYRGIWIYMVAPTIGAVTGAWVYNILRDNNHKPTITKNASFN